MYSTTNFLELYKTLERWAEAEYGDNGVKDIEQYHPDRRIQAEVKYFRSIRNVLSHNPNGSSNPLIELTDEFEERFEALCSKLMDSVSQISIPFKDIYKREMGDKVLPTISYMKEKSFSYVPVMNGKKVWGVFSESALFNIIGDGNISMLDDELQLFKIGKYIAEYSKDGVFDFVRSNASIDDIRKKFSEASEEGRRLDVIYITTTGDKNGDLVGLVTIWDMTNV